MPYSCGRFLSVSVVIVLVTLLAACATERRYEEQLDAWIGASERELVESWGPPDSVYELEDTRYLTYVVDRIVVLPGTGPRYYGGIDDDRYYAFPLGGFDPRVINQFCKTSFSLVDGAIVGWRWDGNDCRA